MATEFVPLTRGDGTTVYVNLSQVEYMYRERGGGVAPSPMFTVLVFEQADRITVLEQMADIPGISPVTRVDPPPP